MKSPQHLQIWSLHPQFHIQDLQGYAHYQHCNLQKTKARSQVREKPPQDNVRHHIKHLHTPKAGKHHCYPHPHVNLTTDKRNTQFRTNTTQQQHIPTQFLHFKTSQTTTTTNAQSTTETKHHSRTFQSASTILLASVSNNSYRPFHKPSSKSRSTSNTVFTTDMEYMCILRTKHQKNQYR